MKEGETKHSIIRRQSKTNTKNLFTSLQNTLLFYSIGAPSKIFHKYLATDRVSCGKLLTIEPQNE